jgi:hypothetical protein
VSRPPLTVGASCDLPEPQSDPKLVTTRRAFRILSSLPPAARSRATAWIASRLKQDLDLPDEILFPDDDRVLGEDRA